MLSSKYEIYYNLLCPLKTLWNGKGVSTHYAVSCFMSFVFLSIYLSENSENLICLPWFDVCDGLSEKS